MTFPYYALSTSVPSSGLLGVGDQTTEAVEQIAVDKLV